MSNWREGQRVKIVSRPVTDEDRKTNRYFTHMAGLVGTISSVFAVDQIAVNIENDTLTPVSKNVHKVANDRMREKFLNSVGDEQKKLLTQEELKFTANFVLLVRSEDLEAA